MCKFILNHNINVARASLKLFYGYSAMDRNDQCDGTPSKKKGI